jgi:hypothetical protein
MALTRNDLLANANKICVRLSDGHFYELYHYKDAFYITHDLSTISKITEKDALLMFLHPDAKDLTHSPTDYFAGIEQLSNAYSDKRNDIVFTTEDNITFRFSDKFDLNPKVTVLQPNIKLSKLVCHNADVNKDIFSFNGTFFEYAKDKFHGIDQQKALDHYLNSRSEKLYYKPEEFLPVKAVQEELKPNQVSEKLYLSDEGISFKLMVPQGKEVATIKEVKKAKTQQKKGLKH